MPGQMFLPREVPPPIEVGEHVPAGASVQDILRALESLEARVVRRTDSSAELAAGNIAMYRFWGLPFERGRRNLPLTVDIHTGEVRPSVSVSIRDTRFVLLRIQAERTELDRRAAEMRELLKSIEAST